MNDADSAVPACLRRDHLSGPYFPNTSAAGLAAVIVLSILFVLTSFNRLNHTDLWGHLNFGRWIAEHHALPAQDPFAAEPSDVPVMQHCWLGQYLGYQMHRLAGNDGLVLGHALLATLAFGSVMLAVALRCGLAWGSVAAASAFVLALPITGTIRPQLFAMVGMGLTLVACSELPRRRHPLYWLPLVFCLWANLHATIFVGLAVLGVCAAGLAFEAWLPERRLSAVLQDRGVRTMLLAGALAWAGSWLSPHGPLLLVKTLIFNKHVAFAQLSEWRAMTPDSLTGLLLIASAILAVALLRFSPNKVRFHEVALLALFGLATVFAIRMLAWWALVWPWVVLPHAAALWTAWRPAADPVPEASQTPAMRTLMAIATVFLALLVAPPTHALLHGQPRGAGPTTGSDTPLYVTDELVRRQLKGTLFAPMDWGDYLSWESAGRLRPLVYNHAHLVRPESWEAYRRIAVADAQWQELARSHGLRYLVASRQRNRELAFKLYAAEAEGQRVRIVYQDQRCLVAELLPPPATDVKKS